MANHDSFLDQLLRSIPRIRCTWWRRFADDALGFEDATILRVFLPDFHWMSRSCLQRYSGGYQFTGNKLLNGTPMFHALLRILEDGQGRQRSLSRSTSSAIGSISGAR